MIVSNLLTYLFRSEQDNCELRKPLHPRDTARDILNIRSLRDILILLKRFNYFLFFPKKWKSPHLHRSRPFIILRIRTSADHSIYFYQRLPASFHVFMRLLFSCLLFLFDEEKKTLEDFFFKQLISLLSHFNSIPTLSKKKLKN